MPTCEGTISDEGPIDERSPRQRQFDEQLEQFERWAEEHQVLGDQTENTEEETVWPPPQPPRRQ
jgi:hypothetical protein